MARFSQSPRFGRPARKKFGWEGGEFAPPRTWTSVRSRTKEEPMSGTRIGVARAIALGILLALSVLLLAASEARAGKYAVAQCGWYVGADASWDDTTGGAKFRS